MAQLDRAKALETIRRNIKKSGFHIYFVEQHATPRVVYTIGLSESVGAELVMCGAIYYMGDDVLQIVHSIRKQLEAREKDKAIHTDSVVSDGQRFTVAKLGTFTLRKVHVTWSRALMLGAFDYYGKGVTAYQIVPDEQYSTVDVPDMSKEWSPLAEPVWRWLHEPWTYSFPEASTATTNLAALRGERVTEATRWEPDEWEMFAGPGPDVTEKEMRVVPVGCLVGADPSLVAALDLEVGDGIWRDPDGGGWNVWEDSNKKSDT